MTRQLRSYFFGPTGTTYHKFSKNNTPTEEMFRALFDSMLFPAETADTATTGFSGHVKIGSDADVETRQNNTSDGYTRAVMPSQLANILGYGTGNTPAIGANLDEYGIGIYAVETTDGSGNKRKDWKLKNTMQLTTSTTEVTIGNIAAGAGYTLDVDLSGYVKLTDTSWVTTNQSYKVSAVSGDTPDFLLNKMNTAFFANDGANKVKIVAAGITETELNTSVAGNGLTGGGGTPLSIAHAVTQFQFNMLGQLELKKVPVSVLDTALAGDGLTLSSGTQMDVDVSNNIEIDSISKKIQLKNDSTPSANNIYSTNSAGVVGWHRASSFWVQQEKTITVSSSSLQALDGTAATAVTLDVGRTSGESIIIDDIFYYADNSSVAYDNVDLEIWYDTGAAKVWTMDDIDLTTERMRMGIKDTSNDIIILDKDIELRSSAAMTLAGDAEIKITILYRLKS